MSKKVFKSAVVIVIASVVLIAGYLLVMYGRFYNTIGEINLQSPYKQKQFSLENPQKEGGIKYVALGDSLTAGVGSDDVKLTFVYQVAVNFSNQFGKVEVVNLGVPGATSKDLIADQLAVAVNEKPDDVTLLIGVNDMHNQVSVADYKDRLASIVDELLAKTSARIILMNLPYLGAADVVPTPLSAALDMRTKQFNKVIAEVGQSDRIKLIDLYTPSRQLFADNLSYYAADHFHPSGAGYLLFGEIINAN